MTRLAWAQEAPGSKPGVSSPATRLSEKASLHGDRGIAACRRVYDKPCLDFTYVSMAVAILCGLSLQAICEARKKT